MRAWSAGPGSGDAGRCLNRGADHGQTLAQARPASLALWQGVREHGGGAYEGTRLGTPRRKRSQNPEIAGRAGTLGYRRWAADRYSGSMGRTMIWRRLGRLTVTVHTQEVPADDEWAKYVSEAHDHLPLEAQRGLVVSAGGGPNGRQRRMMVEALDGAKVPFAILTNSLLMRSAATAVSWFNPYLKVYGPDDLEQAIAYLGLTAWERTEALRLVAAFESELHVRIVNRHGSTSPADPPQKLGG